MDQGAGSSRGGREEEEQAAGGSEAQGSGSGREGQEPKNEQQPSRPTTSTRAGDIQVLLRKIGAEFRDTMAFSAGIATRKLEAILESLKSDDLSDQQQGLQELCQCVMMSSDDSLASAPQLGEVIPLLVNFLSSDSFELMLYSARSLRYLAENLPGSCRQMVQLGVVPALSASMLAIRFIDVAEESLSALFKISKEEPKICLQSGGMTAVLLHMEFLDSGMQRIAVEAAANMCRAVTPDTFEMVQDQLEKLVTLLKYEDTHLVEWSCTSLVRICEAITARSNLIGVLVECGVVEPAIEMIAVEETGGMVAPLSPATYFGLIRLLAICAARSHMVAETLLSSGISDTMLALVGNSGLIHTGESGGLVRTHEHLSDVLMLIDSVLPAVDKAGEDEEGSENVAQHRQFVTENASLVNKFGQDILPLLMQVSNTVHLRPRVLSIMAKVVHYVDVTTLGEVIQGLAVSSLMASLLVSPDDQIVGQVVGLVELLMEKLPEVFATQFMKEGVVHAMNKLSQGANKTDPVHPSTSEAGPGQPPSALRQDSVGRAEVFLSRHFSDVANGTEPEELRHLRDLSMRLAEPQALHELLTTLKADKGSRVSVYEFLNSGVIAALNTFLRVDGNKGFRRNVAESMLVNVKSLVAASLGPEAGDEPLLVWLVRKLRDALMAVEEFPVRTMIARRVRVRSSLRTGEADQSHRLCSIGVPLKLKLVRHEEEAELKDFNKDAKQSSELSVEPMVTMQALEDWLIQRVVSSSNADADAGPSAAASTCKDQQAEEARPSSSRPTRTGGNAVADGTGSARGPSRVMTRAQTARQRERSGLEGQGDAMSEDDQDAVAEAVDVGEVIGDDDNMDEDSDPIQEGGIDNEDDDLDSVSEDELSEDGEPCLGEPHGLMSYAQAAQVGAGAQPRIMFQLGDVALSPQTTVYQAVREYLAAQHGLEEDVEGDSEKVATWQQCFEETFSFKYRTAPPTDGAKERRAAKKRHTSRQQPLPVAVLGRLPLPEDLNVSTEVWDVLELMKKLDTINQLAPRWLPKDTTGSRMVSRREFICSKVASKITQHFKDPLTVCARTMPQWTHQLASSCKFLFPFETRRKFFYCSRVGLPHILKFLLEERKAASGSPSLTMNVIRDDQGRLSRLAQLKVTKQVRVARRHLLPGAMKIMEIYAKMQGHELEVQFLGEEGTGTGPTLEFYTLLSHELQKRKLKMWRTEDASMHKTSAGEGEDGDNSVERGPGLDIQEHVYAPQGLFPKPIPQGKVHKKILNHFKLLGRAMARALLDQRLLDMDINPLFFKVAQGEPVDLHDIKEIDNALGVTLEKLQAALESWKAGGRRGPIAVEGTALDDLYLTFTLPGYVDYELREKGGQSIVRTSTLEQYIDAVVKATLHDGIELQVQAFREGFEEVLPLEVLDCFYEDEMDVLLRGVQEPWTVQKLADCVKCNHGYTAQCRAVQWFLEIVSELRGMDQRRFVQFVTGSPRLPPGGLASLHPPLTVVKKTQATQGSEGTSAGGTSQDDSQNLTLPSVATCQNYFKLPDYASKDIMRRQLLFAITEGQNSFDLT
ncbi:unnamed protein product [Ostreobium quekettii]|uniref:HECT-type E3 ubiquitin transferase n=1 Tax=Ostreobium quekettii TaxID=121088 RepID=A0A8S1JCJ5_9CHLO|nr:unnamed protein product [Ostreobium quekettii]